MRAVLDTNVLISAYLFPGGPTEAVIRLAIEGRLEIATSRPLLAEFGRVLETKFGWVPARVSDAVAQVARVARVLEPAVLIAVVLADPADDRVLEAALAFKAETIVGGDRHLLDLEQWREIRMLTPAQFLAEWPQS